MILISIDESSHSTQSTLTVRSHSKKPRKRAPTSNSTAERHVCFNEHLTQFFDDNKSRCANDCSENWYNEDDYDDFRGIVKERIQKCHKEQKNNHFLSEACQAIRDLYQQVHEVDYILPNALELMAEDTTKLNRLSELISSSTSCDEEEDDELIGLEHQLVLSVKNDLRQRRDAVQDAVHDIQCERRQGLWPDEDEMQKEIKDSCLHHSQCSALFFQLLAVARYHTERGEREL